MEKYKKHVNVHNEMELGNIGSIESNIEPQRNSVVTEQPTIQLPISQHPGTSTVHYEFIGNRVTFILINT